MDALIYYRVPSVTSNGAESGTEEDEEMAAEEDDSDGEDDLPMEMVEDAGRSNKVGVKVKKSFFLISLSEFSLIQSLNPLSSSVGHYGPYVSYT